ncbi:polysaccharide biosynthesis/export family protein [Defluviimonas sp. WL0002]|uniref:Polysaccharide biosynthesis/export family protein n=1 Tax=Albidovulum marisflavi TaxID=2984159 RepID=A0ABT2ZEI6_9RHOB|nr:polysaccharide biosynthesis/export family protein [Defluviimonas sp. WL0002]MCV2869161.1 polysaccharide biosynthesis/export family protein [Defluviimonas sp. WL0002]
MKRAYGLGTRSVAVLLLSVSLAGCGLPRSGPSKSEILAGSVEKLGTTYIVPVDARVARAASKSPELGFSADFVTADVVGSDVIHPGDTLSLVIWENVDDGLLASKGVNATELQELQVDDAGFIFVPYAGRIRASGNTPETLRQAITDKLKEQTPDPQVLVSRAAGDGATVSVLGNTGAQGVFPIERPTRTLSSMLARAGGIAVDPETAQITVTRRGRTGSVWLKDLYRNPRMDIALRGGDVILVEKDTRTFTALGATGGQTRVDFDSPNMTAIEAIAKVGGLNTNLADPKGVFIMRDETPEIASAVLGQAGLRETQRVAYVLDLTQPDGIFNARDFIIRDGDTIYVTEAPYVQWQKTLSVLTGTASSANAITNAAGG